MLHDMKKGYFVNTKGIYNFYSENQDMLKRL